SSSPVRKVAEERHGAQVNSEGSSPHVILGNQVLSTKIHHYIGRSSHLQPRQFTIVFSTVRSQLALHQSPLASESVIFRAMWDEGEEILLEDHDEAQEAESQSCANSSIPAPACRKMDPQYRFVDFSSTRRNYSPSVGIILVVWLIHPVGCFRIEAFANER